MKKLELPLTTLQEATKAMRSIPIVEAIVLEQTTIGEMPFDTLYIIENTSANYLKRITGKKYFEKTDELHKKMRTNEEKKEADEVYKQEKALYDKDIEKFHNELNSEKLTIKYKNSSLNVYTTNKTSYVNGEDGEVYRDIHVLFDRTNRIIIEEDVKVKIR